MSYCAIADVQALNPKRTYSATSTPTSTQVTALIDQVAEEIDGILGIQGYTVPITTPASFLAFLGVVNAYGAAALAESGMFPEIVEPGQTAHWTILNKKYETYMAMLREGKVPASLGATSGVGSYYTEYEDQDEYPDPAFRVSSSDKEF